MTESKRPKNILITGAAGGLGRCTALACAAGGAQVLLLDQRLKDLENVCDEVEGAGGLAPGFCQVDLATLTPDGIQNLLRSFSEAYGELHAVVHCAARFEGLRPLAQTTGEEWLLDLQVNLNVAWLLSVSSLPGLRQTRGNLIFLLDSPPASGKAFWGGYGVAKAAIESLARMLAAETEGNGITVLGVDPGPMRTPLRASAYLAEDPSTIPSPELAAAAIAELALAADPRGDTIRAL